MILCECGEFVEGSTFKDYIATTSNPSTPTIGHKKCGLIFNFIDMGVPKRYSSKVELKRIAMKYAEMKKLDEETVGKFLLEVDRLKFHGKLCDMDVLVAAFRVIGSECELR